MVVVVVVVVGNDFGVVRALRDLWTHATARTTRLNVGGVDDVTASLEGVVGAIGLSLDSVGSQDSLVSCTGSLGSARG